MNFSVMFNSAIEHATDGWNHESGNISEIIVDENNPNFKSVDGILFSKDGKTIVAHHVAKSGKYDIPTDVNKIADDSVGKTSEFIFFDINGDFMKEESLTSMWGSFIKSHKWRGKKLFMYRFRHT